MDAGGTGRRFRFGVFEADVASGELRRGGVRVRLHAQPFQVLVLLLERPGEVLTREEISRELWPEGTFVDYERGVNSAVNRLREALGDKAANPRFVETLARRGYRFVAPVQRMGDDAAAPAASDVPEPTSASIPTASEPAELAQTSRAGEQGRVGLLDRVLARPEDLPVVSSATVRALFLSLQLMYLGFYVGALANLPEIHELVGPMPAPEALFVAVLLTAALLIPVRIFLISAMLFRAPHFRARYLRVWPFLLVADLLWALAPFLLLHHISFGLALACVAPLVYAPLAQRSLMLMGAAPERDSATLDP